jgi:hypothetical protein
MCSIALPALAQQDPQSFAANLRLGESVNGFPNWSERVILEWMNRARVDPQAELAACGAACGDAACYKPIAPLVWMIELNRSARFHADEMSKQGYSSHNSNCIVVPNINALYPTGCDGSASCGCAGGVTGCPTGNCTAWNERIAMFGAGPSGEVFVTTEEPNLAFYAWMYEHSNVATCGFGTYNGHRWLILTSTGGVGIGASGRAVGDFGGLPGSAYKIPSAAHYPKQDSNVVLWANWYDTAAPKSASAVVDGKCASMSLQRGKGQSGAWSVTASGVGSGCHRYYFSFIDSTGAEVTYPATGSLGIGGDSCEDWNSSRLTAKCSTSSAVSPARRHAVKRR